MHYELLNGRDEGLNAAVAGKCREDEGHTSCTTEVLNWSTISRYRCLSCRSNVHLTNQPSVRVQKDVICFESERVDTVSVVHFSLGFHVVLLIFSITDFGQLMDCT